MFLGLYGCFLKMVVPPKHPKMIIFSRKTHGCWVPLFSETSTYKCINRLWFQLQLGWAWGTGLPSMVPLSMVLEDKDTLNPTCWAGQSLGVVYSTYVSHFLNLYIYLYAVYSSVYFSSLFVRPSSFHPPAQCDLTVRFDSCFDSTAIRCYKDMPQALKTNATYTRKAQGKPCLQTVSSLTSWHVACPGCFRMICLSQIWWVTHCGISQKPSWNSTSSRLQSIRIHWSIRRLKITFKSAVFECVP